MMMMVDEAGEVMAIVDDGYGVRAGKVIVMVDEGREGDGG